MRLRHAYSVFLAFALAGTAAGEHAWVRFDPPIPGDATAEGRSGWAVVKGFRVGSGLAEGQPGAFFIHRQIDSGSGAISEILSTGRAVPTVDIDIAARDATEGSPLFVRVRLENVHILSQSLDWTGNKTMPTEDIELGFDSITYVYFTPLDEEADGVFARFSYDSREGESGSFTGEDPIGGGDGPSPGPVFRAKLDRIAGQEGAMMLSWPSVAGNDYIVEWTPDLIVPFEPIRTIRAEDSETSIEISVDGPSGFFRVRPE